MNALDPGPIGALINHLDQASVASVSAIHEAKQLIMRLLVELSDRDAQIARLRAPPVVTTPE